jgi:adenylate kinase
MGCGASRPTNPDDANKKDDIGQATLKRRDSVSSNSSVEDDANKKASRAKPVVVFVLGGPGSGKGTQCERIVKEYGFTHFSIGDLLRAEKASGSKTANLIDEYIKEGKLVPAKIPVKLLKKAMKKAGWEYNYYLVDGFPRNQENMEAFEKVFKNKVEVKFCIYFECSFETMEARIMERAKTSGRSDDNLESLKKRFDTYQNETKPVIELFESKNLIKKINAERSVDEVYADTHAALETIKDCLKPPKPSAIFVLGGPGSGKGTQCEKIIADFGLKHLSVGDLLRAEKTTGSEIAKQIEECMTQGKLVPSEVPVKLLKQAIESAPKGVNFLIDGFPRNQENIDEWKRLIGDSVEIRTILYFDCSLKTMEKRILERGKTSGRSDDNPESLKKRFDTYQTETAPVIAEYTREKLIVKISAENAVDKVYKETKKALKKVF